ncbi:F-box domain containing protein [Pandoravirus quercus]|uniref:F-box domain containing protein n=1 Tax=Pandoravirus quercus TaxID=2107709 RepID=A0A2U7U9P7_9VIRU|nr:F-box domain containing protein [Pandoravirus quercus]AVK75154.1 F-box domain containing protein [Pandoravirus quercus]
MDTVVFDALPDEMVCAVLRWLPSRWLWLASFVSRRWRRCAETVGPRVLRLWATVPRHVPFFGDEAASTIGALLMDEAAGMGHTSVVLWLHRHLGIRWTANTIREAALGGHKHTIDCVRDQQALPLPVDESCLLAALIGGPGIQLAQAIHDAGQPWTATAMAVAVALGESRTISELQHAGCPHDDLAIVLAIVCGRRDLLDAMAVTDGEIQWTTFTLGHTSPYCQQMFVGRRCASVVCDALILGIRGRHLAEAILDRVAWIRSCRHHHQLGMRDTISPFALVDFHRGLLAQRLVDGDMGAIRRTCLSSYRFARDDAKPCPTAGARPILHGLNSPHDCDVD